LFSRPAWGESDLMVFESRADLSLAANLDQLII
jgi:hypothetical protein